MRNYMIVYPEEWTVSEKRMRGWALDAIADGIIAGPDSLTTDELAGQLEDAGLITFVHCVELDAAEMQQQCSDCGRPVDDCMCD